MFEYLKSFQTLRNTTLSSLRKPWCSQTLSFIRCGSGLPEIPLAMHPGLSRTSIRTLILTGLWLGRSVSSLKILESLGKFIPERDNLQYSSFQLKKKKKTEQSPSVWEKQWKGHTSLEWLLYMKVAGAKKAKSCLHLESAPKHWKQPQSLRATVAAAGTFLSLTRWEIL